MKIQIVAVILSMSYLLVFAQTSNDTSHLYRIGDIIYSNSIGNIYIDESGDCCTWNFRIVWV